jgi:hypothetical protein
MTVLFGVTFTVIVLLLTLVVVALDLIKSNRDASGDTSNCNITIQIKSEIKLYHETKSKLNQKIS